MKEIRIKKKDLCPCDPLPHVNHQLCQGCRRKVPVYYEITAFCNSVSYCEKCPPGSKGDLFKQMTGPFKVILEDE